MFASAVQRGHCSGQQVNFVSKNSRNSGASASEIANN